MLNSTVNEPVTKYGDVMSRRPLLSPKIEARIKNLEARVKRIEDELQFSPGVVTFDWKDWNLLDQDILRVLSVKGRRGAATTEIARELNLDAPEASGRVTVYRRLKRIERISRKLKGYPLVVSDRKRWSLNFEDFQFHIKKEEKTE